MLRAVLRLDDGSETEDVLLANSGAMLFETGAHLVEVPAYFGSAKPSPKDVAVKEAGAARKVEQVIAPQDAPLQLALLIDASSSMTEHMLDVQEAAARFVADNVAPRDKTMVVAFDASARIVAPWTNDRKAIESSILRLTPGGGTAVYDALITALLQLQASGSRKGVVVFSDGIDVSSVFSSGDAAEVARRAGVPIYVLALTPGRSRW
jgi:VWFA-related protein